MYSDQQHLAAEIITTLRRDGLFDKVTLIGSIAQGRYDSMSDIDLILVGNDRPPRENVELASQLLEDKYGCMLADWAGSLIPNKYLMSHFLPGLDIMWWIDIGCYPNPRYENISRSEIEEEWNAHTAKLIVMNAKHYLRGTKGRLRISELYSRAIGYPPKEQSVAEMFTAVRAKIDGRLLSGEFTQKMDSVLEQVVLHE